nr:ABC transporter permease [Bacteroidota bacterium]
MIRNYLKTALRNILRNKLFSFLNILGLALGMATTVLILFWVKDELSYDKYNVNHDRIYRVIGDYYMNGMRFNIAASPPTLAAAVLNDYPEVQQVCRFRDAGSKNIRIGEKLFEEGQVLYADSSVFDVFTIPILVGAENNHLASPGTTVISEKFAAKYFDIENPVGKTVRVFNEAEDKYENFYIT